MVNGEYYLQIAIWDIALVRKRTEYRPGGVVFALSRAPKYLAAGCIVAIFVLTAVQAASASTAKDIADKIAALRAAIKEYDGKDPVDLATINGLRLDLLSKKLIRSGVPDAFIQYSGELQNLLGDGESVLLIQAQSLAVTSAEDLARMLESVWPETKLTERFAKRLKQVSAEIDASVANQVILAAALNGKPDEPIPEARLEFDTAWAKITDFDYKIHVLRATFGDLRTTWNEGRRCDATLFMKTQCTGLAKCIPFDPAKQTAVCGFDPAPLVDPKFKGIVVDYTCVRGGKQVWDSVLRYPGTDPAKGSPWKPEDINQVVVRSEGMALFCPFPVRKAGDPPQ